jgi:small subunit ribosomal protein S17
MSTQTKDSQAAGRSQRAKRIGMVSSAARNKTIAVTVDYLVRHPKYGKFLKRNTVLHAHDEKGEAKKGDIVEVAECRPLSKTKRWRLIRIITRAPEQAALKSAAEQIGGGA